jgi:hypothetical protein
MRLLQEQPERVGYLFKERVFDIATVVVMRPRLVVQRIWPPLLDLVM